MREWRLINLSILHFFLLGIIKHLDHFGINCDSDLNKDGHTYTISYGYLNILMNECLMLALYHFPHGLLTISFDCKDSDFALRHIDLRARPADEDLHFDLLEGLHCYLRVGEDKLRMRREQ